MSKNQNRMSSHKECEQCQQGHMCSDLKRELSKLIGNQSIGRKSNLKSTGHIDVIAKFVPERDRDEQKQEMVIKLRSYAIPELYIDVLVKRFVCNYNYHEIAQELSILSWQTVKSMLNKAMQLLKERGYK